MSLNHTRAKLRHRYWVPKDSSILKSVLRLTEIVELIPSDDREVSNVLLRSDHIEGLYPVTILRYLEYSNVQRPVVDKHESQLNMFKRPASQAVLKVSSYKE